VPRYLAAPGGEDPSEVVIDEVAGQLLALSFTVISLWRHGVATWLLAAWPGWVAPFLLFRLFDIWKPWLVGRADRRGDAAGVMLDDLWAGLFAGIVLGRAGGALSRAGAAMAGLDVARSVASAPAGWGLTDRHGGKLHRRHGGGGADRCGGVVGRV
jgi:hypothetical protein